MEFSCVDALQPPTSSLSEALHMDAGQAQQQLVEQASEGHGGVAREPIVLQPPQHEQQVLLPDGWDLATLRTLPAGLASIVAQLPPNWADLLHYQKWPRLLALSPVATHNGTDCDQGPAAGVTRCTFQEPIVQTSGDTSMETLEHLPLDWLERLASLPPDWLAVSSRLPSDWWAAIREAPKGWVEALRALQKEMPGNDQGDERAAWPRAVAALPHGWLQAMSGLPGGWLQAVTHPSVVAALTLSANQLEGLHTLVQILPLLPDGWATTMHVSSWAELLQELPADWLPMFR
jgi:hypothetical protein